MEPEIDEKEIKNIFKSGLKFILAELSFNAIEMRPKEIKVKLIEARGTSRMGVNYEILPPKSVTGKMIFRPKISIYVCYDQQNPDYSQDTFYENLNKSSLIHEAAHPLFSAIRRSMSLVTENKEVRTNFFLSEIFAELCRFLYCESHLGKRHGFKYNANFNRFTIPIYDETIEIKNIDDCNLVLGKIETIKRDHEGEEVPGLLETKEYVEHIKTVMEMSEEQLLKFYNAGSCFDKETEAIFGLVVYNKMLSELQTIEKKLGHEEIRELLRKIAITDHDDDDDWRELIKSFCEN